MAQDKINVSKGKKNKQSDRFRDLYIYNCRSRSALSFPHHPHHLSTLSTTYFIILK